MAITNTIEPYEVLVRFVGGVVTGAHVQTISTVADGAEVLAVRPGNPVAAADADPATVQAAIDYLTAALP